MAALAFEFLNISGEIFLEKREPLADVATNLARELAQLFSRFLGDQEFVPHVLECTNGFDAVQEAGGRSRRSRVRLGRWLVVAYTERSGAIRIISARKRLALNEKHRPKKSSRRVDDELRPEYDFRSLRVVARGPGRKAPDEITVRLAPDVAETFHDSNSVNEALRFLIRIAKGAAPGRPSR